VFYLGVFAACILLLAKDVRRASCGRLQNISGSRWDWRRCGERQPSDRWSIFKIGDKLYPPIVAYDHSVRTAMTVAVARGVPPSNPFFAHAGDAAALSLFVVVVLQPAHEGAPFTAAIRRVFRSRLVRPGPDVHDRAWPQVPVGSTGRHRKETLLGVGLLCVTGLDILPILYLGLVQRSWLADMEWWNESQITSWIGSLLWVPHNVAALIACFVAFLLLRHQADANRRWHGSVILAGMAFASAAGMSVYVTFTFVVAVALWLLVLIARKDWLETAMFVSAGAVALLWALSYLIDLAVPAALVLGRPPQEARSWSSRCAGSTWGSISPDTPASACRRHSRCASPMPSSCPSTMGWNSDSFSPSAGAAAAAHAWHDRGQRQRTRCLDAGRGQLPDRHISAFEHPQQ